MKNDKYYFSPVWQTYFLPVWQTETKSHFIVVIFVDTMTNKW